MLNSSRFASEHVRPLASCLLLVVPLVLSTWNVGEASEARDYSKLGPYPVGVETLVLVDEKRDDAYAGGKRTLVTEVWYPASDSARGGSPTRFSEFFGVHQDAARLFAEHFGGRIEQVDARFRSIGVRGAKVREGRFPLLVFSHGNGGVRHQNVFQADHLASHGYIVISPDHTGNAGVTPLPKEALRYNGKGRGFSAKSRPKDVSFLIDEMLARDRRTHDPFSGRVDAGRIGVLGHSFGGFTACKVAESDERVRAILPMTVAYGKRAKIPVFVMLGERDATLGATGNTVARMYYKSCTGPKHLLSLKRGGHFSFTDMDHINPSFGDGIDRPRRGGDPYLSMTRSKSIINAYSLAFFDAYLRGDSAARSFLGRNLDPQEIILTQDNVGLAAVTQDKKAAARAKKAAPPPKTRVLIVTGDDVPAHEWRETTPVTRKLIEEDDRLAVYVCEDPRILETSALSTYSVVVLNFRNPPPRDPGERARANLEKYVREGGGLIALHFAIYAFPTWESYREILGRVWVGRVSGKKVSGHPEREKFPVRVVDKSHEICRGVADFEADDELYSKLQGSAKINVLLDAYSSYSERREPVAWTREYGDGRVFVLVLGHDVAARSVPSFGVLLRQAVAWAANVKVSKN